MFFFFIQIILLQKSISQIAQPNTFTVDTSIDVEIKFWNILENLLTQSFSDCAPHISQCLQQGLPKLLGMARNVQVKFGTKFVFRYNI